MVFHRAYYKMKQFDTSNVDVSYILKKIVECHTDTIEYSEAVLGWYMSDLTTLYVYIFQEMFMLLYKYGILVVRHWEGKCWKHTCLAQL